MLDYDTEMSVDQIQPVDLTDPTESKMEGVMDIPEDESERILGYAGLATVPKSDPIYPTGLKEKDSGFANKNDSR